MNESQQLRQLEAATGRSPVHGDEEMQSLQRAYLSLALLLEDQPNHVDEAALLAALMPTARTLAPLDLTRHESWLALPALAAALVLIVSLAISNITATSGNAKTTNSQPIAIVPPALGSIEEASPVFDPDNLAWDDGWDEQLDYAYLYAAEFYRTCLSRVESGTYSVGEELRELQAELDPKSL